jgi:hypothetical protein
MRRSAASCACLQSRELPTHVSTLALPERIKRWSLTSLCEKVVKIGANVIPHARYTMSQIAEVAVPRRIFQQILSLIARLRACPCQHESGWGWNGSEDDGRSAP